LEIVQGRTVILFLTTPPIHCILMCGSLLIYFPEWFSAHIWSLLVLTVSLRRPHTKPHSLTMTHPRFCLAVRASLLALLPFSLLLIAHAQGVKKTAPETPIGDADADADHERQRSEWFLHGRVVPGKSSAELRHRAYEIKMQARAARLARARAVQPNSQPPASSGGWMPLGPVPLASDATGDGFQDYHQVSGRATAVAIDPADPSGNTLYIGGAQGGVWKSTNAATSVANNVTWTAVTDDQATLSIGSIVIQPGNSNPSQSVVLVGTGEADNSADSYFGLGMLRSADGGNTWTLIPSANSGTFSFSGLGATRMAFSAATGQANTVVAAMAATSEGVTDGALTSNTYRGLYTSTDAGQTWTYDALFSGGASEATSATSVVYNAAAGLFFAAVRYHGFYSSPDGLNWTLLANQPGAPGLLSATACPQNYSTACPIYRGEITVVPGRNEMYVWFISLDSNDNPVDQGIWQSENGGASWAQINDSGIVTCGDSSGCGVEQAYYDLDLLAVPNCADGAQTCAGNPTDLYAGSINLYKCSITSINPTCSSTPFMNLTHVYGCSPLSALAHVHPDQHALGFTIPNAGSSSASDLMYFANDGGIYRALNGFTGLNTGSCSGTNQFDDLNQNLGSMTQFVSFSEHATDPNTLLGGTQDNGSPATATATTSTSWGNVLGGDGGYNAIDPNTGNWFASNPDYPPGSGSLGIQECSSGLNCTTTLFSDNVVVNSGSVGGDDGSFYFPYILDPQSTTSLLVGTCRVWSGPRSGGAFTLLSLNFDTLGIATCTGNEVNVVRALAAGGPSNATGSQVIYATTDGLGPNELTSPIGGNVWATTNATAVSGVSSTFANVTLNGPGTSSINPNQFPISSVAIDTSDPTGDTAYVTVMGFTGGPGHVWQTTNAGASWIDFSGTGANAIPDSPANAVVVDPSTHMVYVGTDVGVFQTPTSGATWIEVGPIPGPSSAGFLPDVAVTALALFSSGGQKLLRASTYGRGVWQFNLLAVPDFQIAVSNTPLTVFLGNTAIFNGTVTALNGYNNSVELSCTAGSSSPPSPCTPSPVSLTPTSSGAAFLLTAGTNTIADYNFNVQGIGSDSNNTTHTAALTLHVVDLSLTTPSPNTVTEPRGATSPPVSFQVAVQGTFTQSVTLSCTFSPSVSGGTCAFTPGAVVNPTSASPVNMTATVTVPAATPAGNYTVTLQAATPGAPTPVTTAFTMTVILNPDFVFSEPTAFPTVNAGSTGTSGSISVASQDGFSGTISLTCSLAAGSGSCSVSPSSVSSFPVTANVTVNAAGLVAGPTQLSVLGTSSSKTHTLVVPFNVADYQLSGPQSLTLPPNGSGTAALAITPSAFYSGTINATCNTGSLGGQCSVVPNPVPVAAGTNVSLTATVNVPTNAVPGAYAVNVVTQDTSGAPSHNLSIPLTVTQDYTIGNFSPSSQSVSVGQSATAKYNFNVLPVGAAYSNAITLSCTVAPLFAGSCNLSPNSVGPLSNSTSAAAVLTVTTQTTNGQLRRPGMKSSPWLYAIWLALPGIVAWGAGRRRRPRSAALMGLALALLFFLPACGGGGSNGGSSPGGNTQQGTLPGTYTITVVGSPASISQPGGSTVTLVVTGSASSTAVSGAWEFVANSTVTSGSKTLIEADLSANGGEISASGPSEVQTATYLDGLWYVNGACSSPSPGQNNIAGTVSGNAISVTFNEGGNVFTGQGTLSGSTISGTYSGSNSDCSDSGTFTGTQVPNLGGTFSGTLTFPDGKDQVTAILTEGSGYSLTFQTTLAGADNGNFTFSGSAVANVAFVSGSINGSAFSLFGYFDSTGTYTGTPDSIAVFDYNTLAWEGNLVKQ